VGHLRLAEVNGQGKLAAPPVEDLLLDGQRQLSRYLDGGQDLPALLAVLFQAAAVGVGNADLCRAVAGVRDEVNDCVLGGLEPRVAAPAASAAAALDGAVARPHGPPALVAPACPRAQRARVLLQGLQPGLAHERYRCLGVDRGVVAIATARSRLHGPVPRSDRLVAALAAARPRRVGARVGGQGFQARGTHDLGSLSGVDHPAGAPLAAALPFLDVVQQRRDLVAAGPALALPRHHHALVGRAPAVPARQPAAPRSLRPPARAAWRWTRPAGRQGTHPSPAGYCCTGAQPPPRIAGTCSATGGRLRGMAPGAPGRARSSGPPQFRGPAAARQRRLAARTICIRHDLRARRHTVALPPCRTCRTCTATVSRHPDKGPGAPPRHPAWLFRPRPRPASTPA